MQHDERMFYPETVDGFHIKAMDKRYKASNMESLAAITRLERLYEIIGEYGLQKYVTFDLGMLTQYDYYTGVIFRGYTYGTGDAIVKGGRYDTLLQKFGKEAASVGLAVVVDELLIAMSRQKIVMSEGEMITMILYTHSMLSQALKRAKQLRKEGHPVQMHRMADQAKLEDYKDYACRFNIGKILYLDSEGTEHVLEVNP